MVSASGDGTVIAFAEDNNSGGPWGKYDVATRTVTLADFESETGTFNDRIAANANGSQFAIPTVGGTFVYNDSFRKLATIGRDSYPRPLDGAYDPVRSLAYFPWIGTSEVRIYDMTTFKQVSSLDFEQQFDEGAPFGVGRTRLSRDGSLLMVNQSGGVRIDRMYEPLSTADASAATVGGQAVAIPVSATLGTTGTISYGVATQPAHGSATGNGNSVIYTPDVTFSGTETFTYQAHYGQAIAGGTITVAVSPAPNHSPIAVNDVVKLTEPKTVVIDALANDSDPDGDLLTITAATRTFGGKGGVSIQNNKILFTPPARIYSSSSITYTISDGRGGTAQARISVRVIPAP